MKVCKGIIRLVSFIFFALALHIIVQFLLPVPLSHIHVILLLAMFMMLRYDSGRVVWLGFFSYLALDMLSPPQFGVILMSGTLSILFTFWLYKYVVHTRGWYTGTLLTLISILIYHALRMSLNYIFSSVSGTIFFRGVTTELLQAGIDVSLTTVAALLLLDILFKKFVGKNVAA